MKKARRSKRIIKYPITTLIIFCIVVLVVTFMAWAYLSQFTGKRQMIENICGPIIAVDMFGSFLLFILFGKRLLRTELNERNKRFEQKVKAGAKILLMQKRAVFANYLIVLCPVLLLIIIGLAPSIVWNGNVWVVATFIPLFSLLIVMGAVFSFVTPKEYVRYERGKIYLFEKPYFPSQIISMEKVYNFKTRDFASALWFDYRIRLDSGEEIYFPKADCYFSFEEKIKRIQKLIIE